MKKFSSRLVYFIAIVAALTACSRQSNNHPSYHLSTISSRALTHQLFYTGMIKPLHTIVVPSPVEGVIIEMPHQYGDQIKKGQLLFNISSAKFLSDYKSALMQYIKAKNDFNTAETQQTEALFLRKNELISEDEFKTKKSNFYAAQLSLLQAKDALESLLQELNAAHTNLYTLNISDIDKITEAIHLQVHSENLRISSPADGILLSQNKNDDEDKKLFKGDAIKQGDILAVIGDMQGVSVHIKVSELIVNQLKIGQKVEVTGVAFQKHLLKGEIKQIDKQGEGSNNGLPVFSVDIIVPSLTEQERNDIHVGMSATVTIHVDEKPQIIIPIAALLEKNGITYVKIKNKTSGQIENKEVSTGTTTADAVAILSGLTEGDTIVVPD